MRKCLVRYFFQKVVKWCTFYGTNHIITQRPERFHFIISNFNIPANGVQAKWEHAPCTVVLDFSAFMSVRLDAEAFWRHCAQKKTETAVFIRVRCSYVCINMPVLPEVCNYLKASHIIIRSFRFFQTDRSDVSTLSADARPAPLSSALARKVIQYCINACIADYFKVVTMPPAAAQMIMKAVGFLLLVHISFQFVVSLFWRHQYTTEHVVTPGDPEPGRLSVAAILPAQMIGAFKPVYL